MAKKSKSGRAAVLLPRFRIKSGEDIALGPGKVELLTLVAETGSISEAAKRMEMSYMRAWSLIQTINVCFKQPVVEALRGGHQRGGAKLTETGRRALDLYRHMEETSMKAAQAGLGEIPETFAGLSLASRTNENSSSPGTPIYLTKYNGFGGLRADEIYRLTQAGGTSGAHARRTASGHCHHRRSRRAAAANGGKSKATARRVQCMTQLQQWGKALQMYANDNADATPRRGQGVRPLTQLNRPEDWFNALAPELNLQGFGDYIAGAGTNTDVPPPLFVCPDARPAPHRYFLTYAMNMYFSPWSLPAPHQMTKIPTPSEVVFLTDGGVGYSSAYPAVAEYSPQARHLKTACLVFVDGHAQNFNGGEIGSYTGVNQRADVIWQFDNSLQPFGP